MNGNKYARYIVRFDIPGKELFIRGNIDLYQHLLIVKYRLVGAYTDKVLSEHVKQVGGKSKRWQGTEEFLAVTQECVEDRKDIVTGFVKAAAAEMVDYDGISAGEQLFHGFVAALNNHTGTAVSRNVFIIPESIPGMRYVILFGHTFIGITKERNSVFYKDAHVILFDTAFAVPKRSMPASFVRVVINEGEVL